jgi:hypothetical protein
MIFRLNDPSPSRLIQVATWITKQSLWLFVGISLLIYGFQTLYYQHCLKRILAAGSLPLALIEIIRIVLKQIEWFFFIAAAYVLSGIITGIMTEIIRKRKNDH